MKSGSLAEKIPSSYTMAKWLPVWKKDEETSFLTQGNAVALQQKLMDLGGAWKKHFDDLAKLRAGKIKEVQFESHVSKSETKITITPFVSCSFQSTARSKIAE